MVIIGCAVSGRQVGFGHKHRWRDRCGIPRLSSGSEAGVENQTCAEPRSVLSRKNKMILCENESTID